MTFTSKEIFLKSCSVSRETLDRLAIYAKLLETWQTKINLVSSSTLPHVWVRHFLDSAQIFDKIPQSTQKLVDMGSGAGFPGLVLAIMGIPDVHLIESDQRKCIFMREVSRETNIKVTVHNARIEDVEPQNADIITARALAPLSRLFPFAIRHMKRADGTAIFLKGAESGLELEDAAQNFSFQAESYESLTSPAGSVLCVKNLRQKTS